MSEFKVLKSIDVLLGGYGLVHIEEELGGGYKITIDTYEDNVWLGFKRPHGTSFLYWDNVQRIVAATETKGRDVQENASRE